MFYTILAFVILAALIIAFASLGYSLGKIWLRILTRRRLADNNGEPSEVVRLSILTATTLGTTMIGLSALMSLTLLATSKQLSPPPRPEEPGYALVKVFFATDRAPTNPYSHYGTEQEFELHLGMCAVSIPAIHKIGRVERPHLWKFEFSPDPNKHMTIQSIREESLNGFLGSFAVELQATRSQEVFVFVHGFNVTFNDAVMRTAQLAWDLDLDAVPVAYSWPSQEWATPLGYTRDLQAAETTTLQLETFLTRIANETGAKTVYLLAHSMGSRPLTAALRDIVLKGTVEAPRDRFRETILAAPDIDRNTFVGQIAPALSRATKRVTLYASATDHALDLSRVPNGRRRLGDATGGVVVVPDMDSIDATAVDTSLGGHRTYEEPSVLSDISYMLRLGLAPADRFGMTGIPKENPTYWVFDPR